LSLQDIASRHKVSERYIQRLFERSGTTFTDFVVEQRLLLAHPLLCDPRNAARKVSDIAHTTGFGDVSYFHRAFRRRFGATPAEVRQKPRQENGK
jgi:AraC-like DNA-binding protein